MKTRVPHHFRLDGREVFPAAELDFRRGRRRGLLVPGLLVGFVTRYNWQVEVQGHRGPRLSGRSQQIWLNGTYTGEKQGISVPVHRYRPQGERRTIRAPVFDMTVQVLGRLRQPIGQMAIVRFHEGRSLVSGDIDHEALQRALGVKAVGKLRPYLGPVFESSLHYVPPRRVEEVG
ncbi:MAG TPA: hypothetical protein VGS28_00320 [Candidatus Saccharimonadales bacterium]|nr:hypothetical protein [Candidatus Saccharimonadales bacterium]